MILVEYIEDYCRLRENVEWLNFSKVQTEKTQNNSLYSGCSEK